MNNPDQHRLHEAAEATSLIARNMAHTLDAAADQIARAANVEDVHDMGDLLHHVARIQQIIQQTTEELAPERLPRTIAGALT